MDLTYEKISPAFYFTGYSSARVFLTKLGFTL